MRLWFLCPQKLLTSNLLFLILKINCEAVVSVFSELSYMEMVTLEGTITEQRTSKTGRQNSQQSGPTMKENGGSRKRVQTQKKQNAKKIKRTLKDSTSRASRTSTRHKKNHTQDNPVDQQRQTAPHDDSRAARNRENKICDKGDKE